MEHSGAHFEFILLAVLVCVVIYSLLTKSISQSLLTLPIIFIATGFAISGWVGKLGPADELRSIARLLAEITLVLVLFADASHVQFARLKQDYLIPLRMLLIGMPLTIGTGMLFVYWV